ncbi:type VI secretion system lipoprotein TssJ [Shewanella sp. OPT22]|nr:type VI secretion system lipoprotein TssJ [Shewanella sp. OPT22]
MKKVLICFIALFTLNGCSTISSLWSGEPVAPRLIVKITANKNINPNLKGEASPVALTIYQLADSEAFKQASFIQIFSNEQNVLKAGMLSTRHLQSILPGETRKQTFVLNPETKFIGVLANFADYRKAKNKVIIQPLTISGAVINIHLDGINLTVTGEES